MGKRSRRTRGSTASPAGVVVVSVVGVGCLLLSSLSCHYFISEALLQGSPQSFSNNRHNKIHRTGRNNKNEGIFKIYKKPLPSSLPMADMEHENYNKDFANEENDDLILQKLQEWSTLQKQDRSIQSMAESLANMRATTATTKLVPQTLTTTITTLSTLAILRNTLSNRSQKESELKEDLSRLQRKQSQRPTNLNNALLENAMDDLKRFKKRGRVWKNVVASGVAGAVAVGMVGGTLDGSGGGASASAIGNVGSGVVGSGVIASATTTSNGQGNMGVRMGMATTGGSVSAVNAMVATEEDMMMVYDQNSGGSGGGGSKPSGSRKGITTSSAVTSSSTMASSSMISSSSSPFSSQLLSSVDANEVDQDTAASTASRIKTARLATGTFNSATDAEILEASSQEEDSELASGSSSSSQASSTMTQRQMKSWDTSDVEETTASSIGEDATTVMESTQLASLGGEDAFQLRGEATNLENEYAGASANNYYDTDGLSSSGSSSTMMASSEVNANENDGIYYDDYNYNEQGQGHGGEGYYQDETSEVMDSSTILTADATVDYRKDEGSRDYTNEYEGYSDSTFMDGSNSIMASSSEEHSSFDHDFEYEEENNCDTSNSNWGSTSSSILMADANFDFGLEENTMTSIEESHDSTLANRWDTQYSEDAAEEPSASSFTNSFADSFESSSTLTATASTFDEEPIAEEELKSMLGEWNEQSNGFDGGASYEYDGSRSAFDSSSTMTASEFSPLSEDSVFDREEIGFDDVTNANSNVESRSVTTASDAEVAWEPAVTEEKKSMPMFRVWSKPSDDDVSVSFREESSVGSSSTLTASATPAVEVSTMEQINGPMFRDWGRQPDDSVTVGRGEESNVGSSSITTADASYMQMSAPINEEIKGPMFRVWSRQTDDNFDVRFGEEESNLGSSSTTMAAASIPMKEPDVEPKGPMFRVWGKQPDDNLDVRFGEEINLGGSRPSSVASSSTTMASAEPPAENLGGPMFRVWGKQPDDNLDVRFGEEINLGGSRPSSVASSATTMASAEPPAENLGGPMFRIWGKQPDDNLDVRFGEEINLGGSRPVQRSSVTSSTTTMASVEPLAEKGGPMFRVWGSQQEDDISVGNEDLGGSRPSSVASSTSSLASADLPAENLGGPMFGVWGGQSDEDFSVRQSESSNLGSSIETVAATTTKKIPVIEQQGGPMFRVWGSQPDDDNISIQFDDENNIRSSSSVLASASTLLKDPVTEQKGGPVIRVWGEQSIGANDDASPASTIRSTENSNNLLSSELAKKYIETTPSNVIGDWDNYGAISRKRFSEAKADPMVATPFKVQSKLIMEPENLSPKAAKEEKDSFVRLDVEATSPNPIERNLQSTSPLDKSFLSAISGKKASIDFGADLNSIIDVYSSMIRMDEEFVESSVASSEAVGFGLGLAAAGIIDSQSTRNRGKYQT